MSKSLMILALVFVITGCQRNNQLKRVVKDLSSTPWCEGNPVLVIPKDTKETLIAKLIISNYEIACFKDVEYIIKKKLEAYRKL